MTKDRLQCVGNGAFSRLTLNMAQQDESQSEGRGQFLDFLTRSRKLDTFCKNVFSRPDSPPSRIGM